MKVCAFDPGLKNFAFAFVQESDGEAELCRSGFVPVSDPQVNPSLYLDYLLTLLEEFSPDIIIAERYMFRGSSSIHSEKVNNLIGLLVGLSRDLCIPILLVPASSWKNWVSNNGVDTKAGFLTKHEEDAYMMATWYLSHGYLLHGKSVVSRIIEPLVDLKCKNCRFWLWEDKKRKNQKPCSTIEPIKETDYCSEHSPIVIEKPDVFLADNQNLLAVELEDARKFCFSVIQLCLKKNRVSFVPINSFSIQLGGVLLLVLPFQTQLQELYDLNLYSSVLLFDVSRVFDTSKKTELFSSFVWVNCSYEYNTLRSLCSYA